MSINSPPRSSHPRSILVFMGVSLFTYLLSTALHEAGHYLSYIILGVPRSEIVYVLHPLRTDKMIFMAASTALTLIITALHRQLFPWLDRLSHIPAAHVCWRDVMIAIGLGLAITMIQLMNFNDPTIVMRKVV